MRAGGFGDITYFPELAARFPCSGLPVLVRDLRLVLDPRAFGVALVDEPLDVLRADLREGFVKKLATSPTIPRSRVGTGYPPSNRPGRA